MSKPGIYKRGNIWWIHYTGLDGRQKKESSRSKRFRDAEALLIHRKNEIQKGNQPEVVQVKNHTFRELAERYREFSQYQRGYRNKKSIIKMAEDEFGNLPLKHFTLAFLESYQAKLLASELSEATVNRRICCIKHMFTKAVDWKMASESTMKEVHKVKMFKESLKRDRFLSREEIERLLEACGTDRQQLHLKPIIIFAVNTGCRKSEILRLKWQNVDLEHGFISIHEPKNKEMRMTPINAPLRQLLDGLPREEGIDYVFFNFKTGDRLLDLKRSFPTAVKKAKLKGDVVFHTLRHTFASHLVMSGVDIATVSRLLGHKDLKMTMRYSHLAPNHLSNAVGALAAALMSPSTLESTNAESPKE
ncbi:integrase [Geomonas silvestris]|uniref:Integrase n=1 Tax=Geomonas silvestris TaxID=2740184 RepID=A0A6V8MPY0_9BACT|nr:site-specific integrase [Geomonas silvestris]GFO61679.1 integrase [Geomonas silvestris]